MNYDSLFARFSGRTPRNQFIPALLTLLAVVLFYAYLVTGRTAMWCLVVVLFPAFVLHARRLHDMGHAAWPLAIPTVLMLVAFAIWLGLITVSETAASMLPIVAILSYAAFAVWGCVGKGQPDSNRFGAPVAG